MLQSPRAHDRDAGFAQAMDAGTARRQFTLSLVVVVGMVLAIGTALANMPSLPVAAPSYYTVSIPSASLHAETNRHHDPRG